MDCKGCWFTEGGFCYEGNPILDKNGDSDKKSIERCEKFTHKRIMLARCLPNILASIESQLAKQSKEPTHD